MHTQSSTTLSTQSSLSIFLRFLRFGFLAWGGPVAQIAMIRQELVEEERWISKERFNRVLGVCQALPGPEAHELCCYFGMLARGRRGAILAGLGFMLPGFLLMLAISWWYVNFGSKVSAIQVFTLGFAPGVAALVVKGAHNISKHVLLNTRLLSIGIVAALMAWMGVPFYFSILFGAIIYPILKTKRFEKLVLIQVLLFLTLLVLFNLAHVYNSNLQLKNSTTTESQYIQKPDITDIGISGLRAGLLTFGGAYTSIPFVQEDAVTKGHWLSQEQFLDGLALAGILPAPLIIFTTFVGYVAGGSLGAMIMTLMVFLPAFAFTLIGHNFFERVLDYKWLHSILDGIAAAVAGLIVVTAGGLVFHAATSIVGTLGFCLALLILYCWKSKFNAPCAILLVATLHLLMRGLQVS